MEYQKIICQIHQNQSTKFKTRYWVEINDSHGT